MQPLVTVYASTHCKNRFAHLRRPDPKKTKAADRVSSTHCLRSALGLKRSFDLAQAELQGNLDASCSMTRACWNATAGTKLSQVNNCHFPAVWMPHAAVWDHRWLCEPSTLETKNGHLCMFYMILTSCHAWKRWQKFEVKFFFRHPLSASGPPKQWSSLRSFQPGASPGMKGAAENRHIWTLAVQQLGRSTNASLECRIDFVPTSWCASHRVCQAHILYPKISCMDIMDIEARVRVLSRPQAATQLRRFTKAAQ